MPSVHFLNSDAITSGSMATPGPRTRPGSASQIHFSRSCRCRRVVLVHPVVVTCFSSSSLDARFFSSIFSYLELAAAAGHGGGHGLLAPRTRARRLPPARGLPASAVFPVRGCAAASGSPAGARSGATLSRSVRPQPSASRPQPRQCARLCAKVVEEPLTRPGPSPVLTKQACPNAWEPYAPAAREVRHRAA